MDSAPADTDLTNTVIIENDPEADHVDLGTKIVCFASDTLIDTAQGSRPNETLKPGDLALTRDAGLQPIR